MFDRALTNAEANDLGDYLSYKWGVSWTNT